MTPLFIRRINDNVYILEMDMNTDTTYFSVSNSLRRDEERAVAKVNSDGVMFIDNRVHGCFRVMPNGCWMFVRDEDQMISVFQSGDLTKCEFEYLCEIMHDRLS